MQRVALFWQDIKDFWNRNKSSKKFWIITAVILLIIFLIVRGGGNDTVQETTTVSRADVIDQVILSGRTQSASAVNLGFADSGRVNAVYVTEGDRVYQGQLLASIDTSDLYATDLEKVTHEQDALVASAYRNLVSTGLQAIPDNQSEDTTPPVISGVYTGTEGDYRIRVYGSGAASGASFDVSGLETGFVQSVTSHTTVPVGSRGLYIQFSEVPTAGSYWTISIPNKRAATYSTYLNAYESAKATRDRVISDTQLNQQSVASRISKRKIYAPFSGTIAKVGIKQGEAAGSISASDTGSSATITLISERDYEVILKVPEISVAKLAVGMPVAIHLDAYGKDVVFPGTITSINPAETLVDGVPVYETKVMFSKKDDRIRSGMTATATIVANHHDQVLAIPVSYIHTEKSSSFVYVMNAENKTEKRSVVIGLRGSDSMVEITSGLVEGDRVSTEEVK